MRDDDLREAKTSEESRSLSDAQLREAAARALEWVYSPLEPAGWYRHVPPDTGEFMSKEPPPLDWTTAGALLEISYGRVAIGLGGVMWGKAGAVKHNPTINARNVIEACVLAEEKKQRRNTFG